MAEGEFTLVKQYLQAALARPSLELSHSTPASNFDLYVILVDVAVWERDLPTLQKYTPLAAELVARYEHKLYQAIIHRAQGVAHRLSSEYTDAETQLSQALEGFQKLETRWQIGRTLYELAELALARTDKATARAYFSRALVAFEEMEAVPDAARTRAVLASLGPTSATATLR